LRGGNPDGPPRGLSAPRREVKEIKKKKFEDSDGRIKIEIPVGPRAAG
jgi:hypothetical protein